MSWEKSSYVCSLAKSWTWMGKYASCESLLTVSIFPSAWIWEQAEICMNGFWNVRKTGKFLKGSKNGKRGIRQKKKKSPNVSYKLLKNKVPLTYLKFSELNSDSRNLRNCSLPTGSFRASSMPNPHRFTLCCPGSLLQKKKQQNPQSVILQYSNICVHNLD